jgi:uncharacterized membrane protein required for colicin V production
MVSIFDVVLILILGGFVFYGLFTGLIKMVGYIIGYFAGVWVAAHYYTQAYEWLKWLYFGHENVGKVITFIIVMTVVSRVVGLLFSLIQKVYDVLTIIPFLKSINKLAGGVLGLVEGCLTLGVVIYVGSRYSIVSSFFGSQLTGSQIAPLLNQAIGFVTPLFPQALQILKSLI